MFQDLKKNWFWRIFGSNAVLFLVLLALILVGWRLTRLAIRKQSLNQELANLQQQITVSEKDKQDINNELSYRNSPEGLEKEARQRLNVKKQGESVVAILPENQDQGNQGIVPSMQDVSGVEQASQQASWWQANPQKWLKYFRLQD